MSILVAIKLKNKNKNKKDKTNKLSTAFNPNPFKVLSKTGQAP